eukprot:419558_1
MQSVAESVTNIFQKFQQHTKKLWNESKYFRIISSTGSFAVGLFILRSLYIKMYRKTAGLPSGVIGFPFIGNSLDIFDKHFLSKMCKLGPVVSVIMGPYHAVLINEPHLAKKFYTDPRALNNMGIGGQTTNNKNDILLMINGKTWAERRRIIHSNLMTTMKASYVEIATKKFIKSKVFPIFDKDINNNAITSLKELFRPIGFNIVLQACIGKELINLNDPLWLEFDKQFEQNMKLGTIQTAVMTMFGFNGTVSIKLQRLLTGSDFRSGFAKLTDIVEKFTKSEQNNVDLGDEKDNKDIKLFNDYIENYVNNQNAKFTKRELLSDMTTMFVGATDTTSTSLTFAMLLAAKYPDIQEELHKEVVTAFGNNIDNIELQKSGIGKIPKLRAFVHENLRISPPAAVSGIRDIRDKGLIIDARKYGGKIYKIPVGV